MNWHLFITLVPVQLSGRPGVQAGSGSWLRSTLWVPLGVQERRETPLPSQSANGNVWRHHPSRCTWDGCGGLGSAYSLINGPDDHLVTALCNLDFWQLPLERESPCLMELGCKLMLLVRLWLLLIRHGFTSFIYSLCPHSLAPGPSSGAWCKHVIRNPSQSLTSEDGNSLLSPEKGRAPP